MVVVATCPQTAIGAPIIGDEQRPRLGGVARPVVPKIPCSAIRSFGAEGSRLRGTHRREEQPANRGRGSNSEASAGEDGSTRE